MSEIEIQTLPKKKLHKLIAEMAPTAQSQKRIFTIANFLSVGRLFLLGPLYIFLRQGRTDNGNYYALIIMGIALVTDMLDGLIARMLHQESELGKVLDPVADKAWLGFLGLFLAMPWRENPLPWEYLVVVLFRDLAIILLAIFAFRRTGIVMSSNFVGKITMVSIALTLIVYTVNWTPEILPVPLPSLLLWSSIILMVISSLSYTQRLRIILAKASKSSSFPHSPTSLKTS